MSERIYRWLLRLFPSRFREEYGRDALQLFRDRVRDERGSLQRVRLWLDLLTDLAISLPREHGYIDDAVVSAALQKRLDGVPSLIVLEEEPLGTVPLMSGSLLAIVILVLFSLSLMHPGNNRPMVYGHGPAIEETQARASEGQDSIGAETAGDEAGRNPEAAKRTGVRTAAARAAASEAIETSKSHDSRSNEQTRQAAPTAAQTRPDNSTLAARQAPQTAAANDLPTATLVASEGLSAADRVRVVDEVSQTLKQFYPDRGVAQKISDGLQAHLKGGDDDSATDGQDLAARLNAQIREAGGDKDTGVVYSRNPFREAPAQPSAGSAAAYRRAMEASNCTFTPVQILPNNIGYLKLDSFPDPVVCAATAKAAMASLNQSSAIIFDLRENRGGQPTMVMLIASYLFDHPVYMFNPRESSTTKLSWTRPVAGSDLADKPVYILTSSRTFSGAEHFSYDLKMLKRATLVGERTGGAPDVGVFHRMDEHFGIGLPGAAINPYPEPDWGGVGVEPDVKVSAADALETAQKLAASKIAKK
jgi:hypothetical protein